jgi:hypothetical protein
MPKGFFLLQIKSETNVSTNIKEERIGEENVIDLNELSFSIYNTCHDLLFGIEAKNRKNWHVELSLKGDSVVGIILREFNSKIDIVVGIGVSSLKTPFFNLVKNNRATFEELVIWDGKKERRLLVNNVKGEVNYYTSEDELLIEAKKQLTEEEYNKFVDNAIKLDLLKNLHRKEVIDKLSASLNHLKNDKEFLTGLGTYYMESIKKIDELEVLLDEKTMEKASNLCRSG